jgi:hypothetical protein
MLDGEILPEVRRLAGDGRRVTLIFEREGWSPKCFEKWAGRRGFDMMRYRKGRYDPWPLDCSFEEVGHVRGKTVRYRLGQRSVRHASDKTIGALAVHAPSHRYSAKYQ